MDEDNKKMYISHAVNHTFTKSVGPRKDPANGPQSDLLISLSSSYMNARLYDQQTFSQMVAAPGLKLATS